MGGSIDRSMLSSTGEAQIDLHHLLFHLIGENERVSGDGQTSEFFPLLGRKRSARPAGSGGEGGEGVMGLRARSARDPSLIVMNT